MRNLFENLKNMEKEENKVVTFDFDDTLALSHWDEDIDWWVHDGPYDVMMKKFFDFKEKGYTIYIVTSRHESQEGETRPSSTTVIDFVNKYNLKPDGIFFTDGRLKASKLKELGTILHHDDDLEEIRAAEAVGINTVLSNPYD